MSNGATPQQKAQGLGCLFIIACIGVYFVYRFATSFGPPVVTAAEFEQLKFGMTLAQVVDAIGAEGDGPAPYVMGRKNNEYRDVQWKNPDRSWVIVKFMNGTVLSIVKSGDLPDG